MVKILTLPVMLVNIALVAVVTACGNTSTSKTVDVPENTKLEISVYELVPNEKLVQLPGFATADSILSKNVMFDWYEYELPCGEIISAYHYFAENDIRPAWVNHCDTVPVLMYLRTPAILSETVSVESVNHIPEYDEDEAVAVFRFNDMDKWAQITGKNIGNRVALAIDNKVVNAPKVNSEITGGACSLTLTKEEFDLFLPNIEIEAVSK